MTQIQISGISHILLDIEGTTCPISFVSETLFPYARRQLPEFLTAHGQQAEVQMLLEQIAQIWQEDGSEEARDLLRAATGGAEGRPLPDCGGDGDSWRTLVPYLELLIRRDQKLTPLKDLQGLIWREGYGRGDLVGPLFSDVPRALRGWKQQKLDIAVYSSGSVAAQRLIYQHSNAGDLSGLFSHWFDTHIGGKLNPSSYLAISRAMQADPTQILFISDSSAELQAALGAGLQCLFSRRDGNRLAEPPATVPEITSFDQIICM